METSGISYRVADFLKQHPPFQAMEERDLVALAARGRVRFHEPHEYILWQGEPHKPYVFVIQQGTVTLWDETDAQAALRDVRGAGDTLGIERFAHAPACLYSARSATDVVIYAFPAEDFEALVERYPYARQFVEAHDTVTADYQGANNVRDLQRMFLHDVIGRKTPGTCTVRSRVREAAQSLLSAGSTAIGVVNADQCVEGIVTVDAVLAWVAAGAGDADQPITALVQNRPPTVGSTASIVDGVLAIAEAGADALAVTSDGSASGRLQALVTPNDLARVFGEDPVSILREIRRATNTRELCELNHRVRAWALQHLTTAGSLDWLARALSLADLQIVTRVIALAGGDDPSACWCVCGASGRGESLTRHAPELVLIVEDDRTRAELLKRYQAVTDALTACDYMARRDVPFDHELMVASRSDWQVRYEAWLRDPVQTHMYLARPLFDLRPVHGRRALWLDVEGAVAGAVDRDFLQLMANDCLASLPPLTFFQDAVVDESGGQTTVFRLEHSALRPLVDVGRVFGLAAKRVLGTSTLERFASARTLLPEHESIFREAADTLRILLWLQARVGIGQGTNGSELPPALLSRHDRHVLKSGFRSILRLLEFTGNSRWFATL